MNTMIEEGRQKNHSPSSNHSNHSSRQKIIAHQLIIKITVQTRNEHEPDSIESMNATRRNNEQPELL